MTALDRFERQGAIAQQEQGDQARHPERGIFPAPALVGEQPAIGAMHENNRAEHLRARGDGDPRCIGAQAYAQKQSGIGCGKLFDRNELR